MSNFSTDCLSSVPYSPFWLTTAVRIAGDKFVFFSEEYVYEVGDNEVIPVFFNGEKAAGLKSWHLTTMCDIGRGVEDNPPKRHKQFGTLRPV
ncbi:hypothetical protein ADU37_CDS07170 [Thermococcus sp. 2319x1]|nr:hypothetical protein ADU37_CDS07170 [Thermococcus sp. 2319x1]